MGTPLQEKRSPRLLCLETYLAGWAFPRGPVATKSPGGAIPTSIRYRVQTIIDVMVRLTEAGCELRVRALTHAPARLRLRSGALRIASDINLIDHILPWVVLLLGLSLPSLAVWLLG